MATPRSTSPGAESAASAQSGRESPRTEQTHIHVRNIGVHGWDGSADSEGTYESEDKLREIFSVFGPFVQATVRHRVVDGKNTSWALVTMGDADSVDRALASQPMAGNTALQLSRFSAKIASTSTGAMKRAVQYDKSSSSDKERLRKFQKNKGRLRAAARAGDEPEVRRLLGRDDIDSADANGVTALYWSVRKGHEGVMDILIGARADLDGANDRGWTPLIVAAIYGRSSMVRKLLVAGANHRLADQDGRTALDYAQANGRDASGDSLVPTTPSSPETLASRRLKKVRAQNIPHTRQRNLHRHDI